MPHSQTPASDKKCPLCREYIARNLNWAQGVREGREREREGEEKNLRWMPKDAENKRSSSVHRFFRTDPTQSSEESFFDGVRSQFEKSA